MDVFFFFSFSSFSCEIIQWLVRYARAISLLFVISCPLTQAYVTFGGFYMESIYIMLATCNVRTHFADIPDNGLLLINIEYLQIS